MSNKTLRYALVLAATAAVSVPVVTQALRAQDKAPPAPAPAQPQVDPAQPKAEPAQPKVDPATVVLTVGDQKITAAEFDAFLSDLPPQYQEMARGGPARRMLAEQLVRIKLMQGEAERRKLDQSPKVRRQLEMMRAQVLAEALANELVTDEKSLREQFEKDKSQFDRLKARHILVRVGGNEPGLPGQENPNPDQSAGLTDEQAKAKAQGILKRIQAGEDFAKVAQAESDDTGSGARGGDLGEVARGQTVPEFEKAAFALKKGQISQPVRSEYGYHLIQVQDVVPATFEDVKAQLSQKLGRERVEQFMADLRKSQKVELNDAYFGPAEPPVPPTGQVGPQGGPTGGNPPPRGQRPPAGNGKAPAPGTGANPKR